MSSYCCLPLLLRQIAVASFDIYITNTNSSNCVLYKSAVTVVCHYGLYSVYVGPSGVNSSLIDLGSLDS